MSENLPYVSLRRGHGVVDRAIADPEIISLLPAAQETFASLLLDPPPPSSGLQSAVKRHRRLIRGVG